MSRSVGGEGIRQGVQWLNKDADWRCNRCDSVDNWQGSDFTFRLTDGLANKDVLQSAGTTFVSFSGRTGLDRKNTKKLTSKQNGHSLIVVFFS